MIYTLTLNPAVDYIVRLNDFQLDQINRSQSDEKEAGGKGINVSRVLANFDQPSTALGFIGGFTGKFITDVLDQFHIQHHFVELQDDTRINLKMKAANSETEVNGTSPEITDQAYHQLLDRLGTLTDQDVVVMAGSLPTTLSSDTYQAMIRLLNQKGVETFLDTSGIAFQEAVKASPSFVKPNHHELGEFFNETVDGPEKAIQLAQQLQTTYQIDHVFVSMGKDGAVYTGEAGQFQLDPPEGELIYSVGAGDSTVAGFLYQWQKSHDAKQAAAFAVAAGSATAYSETLCTKMEAEELFEQVKVSKI
ncbi:1-phosphofructokinase [Gracilibacillus halophilus YIM-C55.5]|uniref:Tagatose-6-phosphate kinase n=1 Tax=Gracilibacillus halophilus YIM-C55.5 TaxID=1308866 RepID=N4WYP7_9BACI|nr:1-phosphofructokinase [Gracilibacillus halophilus]ENH98166.1 1-phosphofructokinase [Gracilibacillus halophilus YIM-C55.5]